MGLAAKAFGVDHFLSWLCIQCDVLMQALETGAALSDDAQFLEKQLEAVIKVQFKFQFQPASWPWLPSGLSENGTCCQPVWQ